MREKTFLRKVIACFVITAMVCCIVPAALMNVTAETDGFTVPTMDDFLTTANTWPGTIDVTEVENSGVKITANGSGFLWDHNVGMSGTYNLLDLTLRFHGYFNSNYFSVRLNSMGYNDNTQWGPGGAYCLRIFMFHDQYNLVYRVGDDNSISKIISGGVPLWAGLQDKDWFMRFMLNDDESLRVMLMLETEGNIIAQGNIPKSALDSMNIDPYNVYLSFGFECGDAVSNDSILLTGYRNADSYDVPSMDNFLATSNTWADTIKVTGIENTGVTIAANGSGFVLDHNVGMTGAYSLNDLTLRFNGYFNANYFSVRLNSMGYNVSNQWGPGGAYCLRIFMFHDQYSLVYREGNDSSVSKVICGGIPRWEALQDKDWYLRFKMNGDGSLGVIFMMESPVNPKKTTVIGQGNIPKSALDNMNIDPDEVYLSFGFESGDALSNDSLTLTGCRNIVDESDEVFITPMASELLSTANTWANETPQITANGASDGVEITARGGGYVKDHNIGLRALYDLDGLTLNFRGYYDNNYFAVRFTSEKYNADTEWGPGGDYCLRLFALHDNSALYYRSRNYQTAEVTEEAICGLGAGASRQVLQNSNWSLRFSVNDDGSLHVKYYINGIRQSLGGNIPKSALDNVNLNPNRVYLSFGYESADNITDGAVTFTGYNAQFKNVPTMNDMLKTCNDWSANGLLTVSEMANGNGVQINVNGGLDSVNFLEYNMGAKPCFSLRDLTLDFNGGLNNNYFEVRLNSVGYNENEGIAGGKNNLRFFVYHDLGELWCTYIDTSVESNPNYTVKFGGAPYQNRAIFQNNDWSYHFSMNDDGSLKVQLLIAGKIYSEGNVDASFLAAKDINPDKVFISFGFASGEGGTPTTGTVNFTGYGSSYESAVSAIDAIGTVDYLSESDIAAARRLYNNVPDNMKKYVTNYTVLVLAESTFANLPMPGDLVNDGVIDSADLVELRKALLLGTAKGAADVNRDRRYNIIDLICLKKLIAY